MGDGDAPFHGGAFGRWVPLGSQLQSRVEFGFGAAFTPIRTVHLQAEPGRPLAVDALYAAASGRLWVADARARALHVYSGTGWRTRSLNRERIGLRRPVSLAHLHSRWVVVLDGGLPAVAVLDEAGRPLRRFPLPELDRPQAICNLGDRRLAAVGSGWGPGRGRLVHLYTPAGDYIESLFSEPRDARPSDRVYAAAAGHALYLAHSRRDSFAIYDVEARAILAFPRQAGAAEGAGAARELRAGQVDAGAAAGQGPGAAQLGGLFATSCGPLLALYHAAGGGYLYDLYGLDGTPITLGLASDERVVDVEGPFFYSLRQAPDGGATLRVWRLSLEDGLEGGLERGLGSGATRP